MIRPNQAYTARILALKDRHNALRDGPAPDSPAAKDISSFGSFGSLPWRLACNGCMAAIDHLVAWNALLSAGIAPVVAGYTLCRASFEGAVLCRWFIDPGIPQPERLRRAAAMTFDEFKNSRLLIHSLEALKPGDDRLKPQKQYYEQQCQELTEMIKDHLSISGGAKAPEMSKANLTQLFGLYAEGGGESVYRSLSGAAHGVVSIIGSMSVRGETEDNSPVGLTFSMEADPFGIVITTHSAIGTTEKALFELEGYGGRSRP